LNLANDVKKYQEKKLVKLFQILFEKYIEKVVISDVVEDIKDCLKIVTITFTIKYSGKIFPVNIPIPLDSTISKDELRNYVDIIVEKMS
jgi:hypothetical protein